jgi:hypothetical protein
MFGCILRRREGAADAAGGDAEAAVDEPREAAAPDTGAASAEQLEEQEQLRQAALDKLQAPKQTSEGGEDGPADVKDVEIQAPVADAE